MAKVTKVRRPPYPRELREQLIDLVRAGESPESVAQRFEPSAQCIRSWMKQADLDDGKRNDGLTTTERDELARLRREVRTLRQERVILKKFVAWFAQENTTRPKRSGS